jgi:hypothetical protein
MFSASCFSQNFERYRINERQKRELLRSGDSFIIMIEDYLDENEESLSNDNHPTLTNPNKYIESAKKKAVANPKLYKDICFDCYISEYEWQENELYDINDQEINTWDRESEARKKDFELENQERDNVINSRVGYAREKPYDRFLLAMDMLGKKNGINYGQFTIFTNMDEELVRTRFSLYLQDYGFTYGDDSKQINEKNYIQEYYIPKISINEEVGNYIEIKYLYSVRNDLPSYYTTTLNGDYPCWIIDKVVINGTTNSIINLYVDYWLQSRRTIDSNKTGEIASHTFMGDHISLQYVSKNKCRIEITKQGGGGVNYYSSYKISEMYNDLK